MKYSYYNIPIELGNNRILIFNSFRKSYSIITNLFWSKYFNTNDFQCIEDGILQQMKDNGFIIDDNIDECAIVLNSKIGTRLQTNTYHIIINPTLECNLNCWYCYEEHKMGSHMKPDLEINVLRHLELKYILNPFKCLQISFFGGEPLLRYKQIYRLINNIDSFCKERGVELKIDFTTNGTILPPLIIQILKNIPSVFFQITLDGSIEQHNKIRYFKNRGEGTFHCIFSNIERILSELPNAYVTIRINFNEYTFRQTDSLRERLLALPYLRFNVSLHKVWQVASHEINYEQVLNFIDILQGHNIDVRFLDFNHGETTCYADKINSIVINYDGSIYKCTARNFNCKNRIGNLLDTGEIHWDYAKLKEYCFSTIPLKCKICKIFPVCVGICSQQIMEQGEQASCIIERPFDIQDYILYNYKINHLLKKRTL